MGRSINVMQINAGGLGNQSSNLLLHSFGFGKPKILVVATDLSSRDRIRIFGLHPSELEQLSAK